ncbi:hypothetical protein JTE90_012200 [Oedothorax gibbosus]|uniref:FHA domain-containing protein n=1 Tax=Oedothorax gibbosus TaxID=931172 RepID=A0AAV6VAN7_9ARAC|nr:hypothetical protein JTE90_012200 [Oedothorax gibbosus]
MEKAKEEDTFHLLRSLWVSKYQQKTTWCQGDGPIAVIQKRMQLSNIAAPFINPPVFLKYLKSEVTCFTKPLCAVCDVPMSKHRLEENSWALVGKDGRTHDLSHGMIFIGREECDIVLQAASADKRHAVLCYNNSEQKFHIKDLNSLTGTYVNGIRIPEQTYVKLKRLDCIRFGYGPDVFYLERSSNATSPCKEEPTPSSQKEVKKKPPDSSPEPPKPHRQTKPEDSPPQPKSHSNNKCDLPALTRGDHPPDTLPLHLPPSRDKDWEWVGQDGASSDSPDYSQRSETSSFSAPANYGTTPNDERDTGSAHSSPAATAFTIAFETDTPSRDTPRKKLGIRDSISKFAPPNKIVDTESRVTFQKTSKTEPSPKKLPVTDAKPPLPKARTQFGTADLKDINEEIGKITDSTSFLIKKMLNGELSPEPVKVEKPVKEKELDACSEAGTYTVETEEPNCDVEEARKKIDEVFGVVQMSSSMPNSSYSSSTTSSSNKQIPRLNGRLKQPILKTPIANPPNKRDSGINWNSGTKSYTGRPRGQGPTPAASTESLNHSDTLPGSLRRARTGKTPDAPTTPDRTRRSMKVSTSPKSPAKTKTTVATLKSPGAISNNLSAAPSSRESLNSEVSRRHSTDSRSEGSKSPHSSQWAKAVPWNLSGSDLDLDRSKSENNSVLSDTSTEPSSHSSHSTGHGHRTDPGGPQMRLNRAFALRRARLEAESGSKKGKENRTSTTGPSQPKPMRKSGKLSSSTSTLRDESSSGGGGASSSTSRMSMRLPSNAPRPVYQARTGPPQGSDPMKRKNDVKVIHGHRRMDSDPGRGIPIWKSAEARPNASELEDGKGRKPLPMDTSLDETRLQTFHRSVSCSIVNEASDVPKPSKGLHRGLRDLHRDFPLSLIKNLDSIMSGSQIVSSHNMDDYHCRSSGKEITALDSLVISAIHQLASKLWSNSKHLLERERKKCPKGSDTWLMIDEVLPQGPVTGTPEDGDFTKDLSSILKNLKRVEQGIDVLSSILENGHDPEPGVHVQEKTALPQNFFVVNM